LEIQVVGLGAGGHAKVVLEILALGGTHKVVGLLDPKPELKGTNVLGIPVLGTEDILPELKRDGIRVFFVGLGAVADNLPRKRLFELAVSSGFEPVTAIHPSAVVSPSAKIGAGSSIMANAVVNASAIVGINNIVNTGAVLEHDCSLGDHIHIATGARLSGSVTVGNLAHVGAGATIRQLVNIGERAVIGAGSVIVTDVPPNRVFVGVPGRDLEDRRNTNV